MIDHDYISTQTPCPDCGGRMLIDVAYDDPVGGTPPHQRIDGYDCQERRCGSQYTLRQWASRNRTHGVCDRGQGLVSASKPTRRRHP